MFPNFFQRIGVVIGVMIMASLAMKAAPHLHLPHGITGISLGFAASPGAAWPIFGGLLLIGAIIGGLVGAAGRPLTGCFMMAVGIGVLAALGGSIDPWMRNFADGQGFGLLAIEAAAMGLLMATACMASLRWGGFLVRWFALARPDDALGELPVGAGWPAERTSLTRRTPRPLQSALGLLTAVVIGLVLVHLLLRTSAIKQVMAGLFVAFTAGGFAGRYYFPKARAVLLLVAPLIAATLIYSGIALRGGAHEQMLSMYYAGALWRGGLALPLHYATAGVAGSCMGVGWAQALIRMEQAHQALIEFSRHRTSGAQGTAAIVQQAE